MAARNIERGFIGVDAGDGKTEPRQGLAHQAAAATDIEEAQAGKSAARFDVALEVASQSVADECQPRGVETMKRLERTILVPPLRRDRCKALDFRAIDRGGILLVRHLPSRVRVCIRGVASAMLLSAAFSLCYQGDRGSWRASCRNLAGPRWPTSSGLKPLLAG